MTGRPRFEAATAPTKVELASGDLVQWEDWLRSALVAFTTGTTQEERRRAFAPFSIDPVSFGPAGALAREIRSAVRQANSAPSNATIEVLRRWSPAYDGWEGAALLIELATRLGSRDLYPALLRIIGLADTLDEVTKGNLAFLCVQAADERFKRTEVIGIMHRLVDLSVLRANLVADFAAILARNEFGGLDALPNTLLGALPSLAEPPHSGEMANAIARRLQKDLPPDQLMRALRPKDNDDGDVERFRAELQDILYPQQMNPLARRPTEQTKKEFDDKIGLPLSGENHPEQTRDIG